MAKKKSNTATAPNAKKKLNDGKSPSPQPQKKEKKAEKGSGALSFGCDMSVPYRPTIKTRYQDIAASTDADNCPHSPIDPAKGQKTGLFGSSNSSSHPIANNLSDDLTRLESDCAVWLKDIHQMECSVESLSLLVFRSRMAIAKAGADCYEMEELVRAQTAYEERLIESLESIYRTAVHRQQMRDALALGKEQTKPASLIPFHDEVSVIVLNDTIFVKTPPLFNRNKHWKGREIVDYYAFISQTVAYKMKRMDGKLPQYFEKNVNLLAVYSRTIPIIPDADNLDTKTVTDAITNSLPGGDAGRYCTFSRASIHSDELPPGAYFTVTKGFAQAPDFWGNLCTLIQIFGLKKDKKLWGDTNGVCE